MKARMAKPRPLAHLPGGGARGKVPEWEKTLHQGVNGSLVSGVGVKGQSRLGPRVGRGHPLPPGKATWPRTAWAWPFLLNNLHTPPKPVGTILASRCLNCHPTYLTYGIGLHSAPTPMPHAHIPWKVGPRCP